MPLSRIKREKNSVSRDMGRNPMCIRKYNFFLLSIGVILILALAGRVSVKAQDPFLDACEKVPFPFSDKSVEEEMENSMFSDEVPVPLDTLGMEDADGYVPDVYAQTAPEPPSVLRPRYRSDGTVVKANTAKSHVKSPEKINTRSTDSTSRTIRQVAATEDPFVPSEPVPLSISQLQAPEVPQAFQEEYEQQMTASGRSRRHNRNSGRDIYTVNNAHTCDELTCGAGGCGSGGLFHLSDSKPRHGYCDCCGFLTCKNKTAGQWYFDGWLEVGSFMNTHWPDDRNNAPLYYTDRNGEAVMNQLYFSVGRRIDPRKNRWDIGGRVDLLYGTDFFYTSSIGLETRRTYVFGGQTLDPLEAVQHWNSNKGLRRSGTASLYGLSLPQAYAEVFMPFGYGVTLKAGHFYADMGIESAMAPQNFFYSHSYSFMHGAPVTLTGATATVKLGPRLSAIAGFTEGWDVFDSPTGHVNGLFGVQLKSLDKRSALSFMVHTGEGTMRGNDNRTNYALTFQQKLGHRWLYALEHTYGYEKDGAYKDVLTDRRGPARWVSLAQYLQWQWSDKLSFGFRAEWFRDDGHSRIQKSPVSMPFRELSGKDYYELTLGANWKPTRYLTIRPEIRYDWSNVKVNGQGGVYSGYTKQEMLSFAIDGIFRF